MAYEKLGFVDGQVLTADHMNHLEDGIAGAAPNGYGLGGTCVLTNDWNTAVNNGFYFGINNSPDGAWWYGYAVRDAADDTRVTQVAFCRGSICTRTGTTSDMGAWEWVNPPMALGAEYRTTERCDGKPVYIKYIGLGSAPNNATKVVDAGIFGTLDTVVSVYGFTLTGNALPYYYTSGVYIELSYMKSSQGGFLLRTNYDFSSETCYGVVKYTKTTD